MEANGYAQRNGRGTRASVPERCKSRSHRSGDESCVVSVGYRGRGRGHGLRIGCRDAPHRCPHAQACPCMSQTVRRHPCTPRPDRCSFVLFRFFDAFSSNNTNFSIFYSLTMKIQNKYFGRRQISKLGEVKLHVDIRISAKNLIKIQFH